MKLNSDGCSKGNLGQYGGGEIIRDEKGHLINAYVAVLGHNINNMAEVMTSELALIGAFRK